MLDLGRTDTDTLCWQGAVTLLVQEIVDTSRRGGCTVADVQGALVAELEAGPGRAAEVDRGPDGLIREVCSVLVDCRDGWTG